jgi:hypothetical protein
MPTTYYRMRVEGQLDSTHWSGWFDGMQVMPEADGTTVLSGPVTDQAALHGPLSKIRDLGLVLLSLQRMAPESREE